MPQRHTNVHQFADAVQLLPQAIRLQALDEQQIQSAPWPNYQHSVAFNRQQQQDHSCSGRLLLQQLDGVGWDKITQVSSNLTNITLSLRDAAGRKHQASIQVPTGFPVAAPAVSVDLPIATWKPKWVPGNTLSHLVTQLHQILGSFQAIWEQLEDIDQHTLLLDSAQVLAHPYSRMQRCIALGNSCSCQLQLSSACPTALPQVVFHGPSSSVAELQRCWFGNAHQVWDRQRSVRQNMQAVLQVQLPAPKPGSLKGCAAVIAANCRSDNTVATHASHIAPHDSTAGTDLLTADDGWDDDEMANEVGACDICYALHLPDPLQPTELGALPSSSCSGKSCGRVFHVACLAEWLGSLPDSRRVFDTLFGSCPFCHADISVSLRSISVIM